MRHKRWAIIAYVIGLFYVISMVFSEAGSVISTGAFMAMSTLGDVRWAAAKPKM